MKKFLMIFAAGVFATSTAMAADPVSTSPKIVISAVTDTEYNTKTEVATTEFGIVAEAEGLTLSALPKYNFDTSEIANIEFGVYYTAKMNDDFSLVPYAEVNYDNDFDRGDTIIGVKTKYSF